MALKTHDSGRFNSIFNMDPLTHDHRSPLSPQSSLPNTGLDLDQPDPDNDIQAANANCGQRNDQQKKELMVTFDWFIRRNLFPSDPNARQSV